MKATCTSIFQLPQLGCVLFLRNETYIHLQLLACLGILKNTSSSQFLTPFNEHFEDPGSKRPLCNHNVYFFMDHHEGHANSSHSAEVPLPRRSQSSAEPSAGQRFSLGNPLQKKKVSDFWCYCENWMPSPQQKTSVICSPTRMHPLAKTIQSLTFLTECASAPLFSPAVKFQQLMLSILGGFSAKILGGEWGWILWLENGLSWADFKQGFDQVLRSLLEIRQGTTGEAP